ncbi:hypothetical protein [Jiulongibacter sediminis]|uniref:hypothetical protein n=1 Tax=Jiulongibacter sediminis TaxID=1605367 RepID=UPI0026F1CBE6|nr:hypothetical protein [Jiulongibacter sediminis]
MAVNSFSASGQLANILETNPGSLIYGKLFSASSNPKVGDYLYADSALSTKLNSLNFYGLVKSGQLYEVAVNSLSQIISINLVQLAATPDTGHLIQPAVDRRYDSNLNVIATRSELQITDNAGQKLLTNLHWGTPFDTGTRMVFFSVEEKATAQARTLQNVDITDLEGMDIAPLDLFEDKQYCQTYIHIAANPAKNRRVLVTGNQTYYWMPQSHSFDNSLLPGFYKTFPDFSLPSGKIGTHQFKFEDDYPMRRADNKGFTFSPLKPYGQSHFYDYDGWGLNNGLPPAYSVSSAERQAAWDAIPEANLRNAFLDTVVNPHKGRGLVTLNFEVFVGLNLDDSKMINTLQQWTNANPSALFAFWAGGHGAIRSNRIQFESNSNPALTTPDLKWTGSFNDWVSQRHGVSIFAASWYIFREIATCYYVNDLYQSDFDNEGWIHHAMCQTVMNKKFKPEKKCIWVDSHKVEYGLDGELVDRLHIKDDARNMVTQFRAKPIVSPGQMFSRALFGYGFADGMELWETPFYIHEDPYYHGLVGDDNQDQFGVLLDTRAKDYGDGRTPGKYVPDARSMKGVDWHVAAMWAISENKDIIEANTSWDFLDFSVDGGATYKTGDEKLLSETYINRLPIAICKSNNAGTECLVLFLNPFQNPLVEQSYKIKINGVVHDIFQVGDYASCIRITL